MAQAADGEQRDELGNEPVAAPAPGSERRWLLARVLSLLLMAVALVIPWTFYSRGDVYSGFDVAYWTAVMLSPLLLVPGVAAFVLGVALLWSDRFSPGVSARLSRANIVALCLALPIGFGAVYVIIFGTDGMSDLYWGWPVYLVGVATALVVEIRTFKTMREKEPAAAPASESERLWRLARLVSVLLLGTALILPWTFYSWGYRYSDFDGGFWTAVMVSPLILGPGVAAFLLGGALLWSDGFSPRVSTRLSRANIVALCLALLLGLGAVYVINFGTGGVSGLFWGWPIYQVGVLTALAVEIRTFKAMRDKEPPDAPASRSERFWWLARLVSLLLMAAALFIARDYSSMVEHFIDFQVAYVITAILPPFILVPGVVAILLGGALLLSDNLSPRVSSRLSRANVVALCLLLLIGSGAVSIVIFDTNPSSRLNWGWPVYLMGVATALVVEIWATRKTGLLTLALFALLAVCSGGLIKLITPTLRTVEGDWQRFDAANSPLGEIQVMSVDDQGRAWFFSDGELHVYDVAANAWTTHSRPAGPVDLTPRAVAAHGDQVLITFYHGLYYFDGATWERALEGGFNLLGIVPDGTPWADPGGSLTAEGFWRYDGNAWNRDEAVRECAGGSGFDIIRSDAEGRLWASYGNFILLIEGEECRQIFRSDSGSGVETIVPTSQGSIWMSERNLGIVELDAQGEIVRELEDAPAQFELTPMAVGPDGSLWLGADYGLLRYTPDGEWVNYALPGDVYYFGPKVVLFDQAGGMWVQGFGWVAYLPAES